VLELTARHETWPIRGTFRIARGEKGEAEVVVVEVRDGELVGRGEAVPYARYGETVEGVLSAIESMDVSSLSRASAAGSLAAGAARCAIDCALWELDAKRAGMSVWELAGVPPPRPVQTMQTISIDTPGVMGDFARRLGAAQLKVKLAGDRDDIARLEAIRHAVPGALIVADPNESWTVKMLESAGPRLAELGVSMIEQPVAADDDEGLADLNIEGVSICADEAVHTRADLEARSGRYDAINVKLDKAGGLTEALALAREARARSLGVMVGCMVSTSLAIAPAFALSHEAFVFDLDGPLLLDRDRPGGATLRGGLLEPPTLWGR